jgi:hypothetical protein
LAAKIGLPKSKMVKFSSQAGEAKREVTHS